MWPYATTTPMSGAIVRKASRNSASLGREGCSTGRSSSIATRLMAGGTMVDRVRPRGLSVCVTTATTSNPSPMSARSEGAAKSGVPKKAIFMTRTSSRERLLRCSLFVPSAASSIF